VILPPASPLERSHYDAALNVFAVRNVAKYSPPVFDRRDDQRHDWEILAALWSKLRIPGPLSKVAERVIGATGPEAILDVGLRFGPHGIGRGGLSLAKLRANPHGLDLGPLVRRLPKRLPRGRKVELAPAIYLADINRLEARRAPDGLVVIGRRHLRSNNSWLHNSERLVKGPPRCTLLIHPDDAAARGITDGSLARIATARGSIELPVEVTDSMMPGVVSVPHGWGHTRKGSRLTVASSVAGASLNDVLDPAIADELSGTAALTGQPVEVHPV
jgi:anaerobic selenocysteine-containing dehydrogenase